MSPEPVDHGHCFRCRVRKEIAGATQVRLRNGKMALTGVCITCGARIFRLLRAGKSTQIDAAAQDLQA